MTRNMPIGESLASLAALAGGLQQVLRLPAGGGHLGGARGSAGLVIRQAPKPGNPRQDGPMSADLFAPVGALIVSTWLKPALS
jgi:hypothetical protein